jgi:hypothetical protein
MAQAAIDSTDIGGLPLFAWPRFAQTVPSLLELTTVVSVGGGQDSTAILYRIGNDPAFRAKYAPGFVLAIMSDTGDEHAETIAHIDRLAAFCARHDIEFVYLTFEGSALASRDYSRTGYHSGPWAKGLAEFYRSNRTIGSQAYPKSCTENLKILPIYRFLAERFARILGRPSLAEKKRSLYRYAQEFGKLRVILGIAAGEESRRDKAEDAPCKPCSGTGLLDLDRRCKKCKGTGVKPPRAKWLVEAVDRTYPLIAEGMDRAACQRYIESVGEVVPPPSNCFMCPFKSPIEILWTARHDRERFDRWVALEAAKIEANHHMDSVLDKKGKLVNLNFGVYKLVMLPEVLAKAEKRFEHMTDAEIDEYRMSHGHCTKSAY